MPATLFIEYVLMGLALAADASSVALVYGSRFRPFKWRYAALIACAFGFAQGAMPVVGWAGGKLIAAVIDAFDHWFAFVILIIVGIKFILDAKHDVEIKVHDILKPLPIFLAALATSIDACAVGFSIAIAGHKIVAPAIIIGVVTFLCTLACSRIGASLGAKYGPKFLIVGGIVLIGIGLKILFSHLLGW